MQAVECADVIESVYGRAKAAVQAEYLAINQCGERQEVKQVREVLPHGRVAVLSEALIVETVHLGDLTGLVVTAQDRYSLAIANLKWGWCYDVC